MTTLTIQYERTIARRGGLTTEIKERAFRGKTREAADAAMAKWVAKAEESGRIEQILRHCYEESL